MLVLNLFIRKGKKKVRCRRPVPLDDLKGVGRVWEIPYNGPNTREEEGCVSL